MKMLTLHYPPLNTATRRALISNVLLRDISTGVWSTRLPLWTAMELMTSILHPKSGTPMALRTLGTEILKERKCSHPDVREGGGCNVIESGRMVATTWRSWGAKWNETTIAMRSGRRKRGSNGCLSKWLGIHRIIWYTIIRFAAVIAAIMSRPLRISWPKVWARILRWWRFYAEWAWRLVSWCTWTVNSAC